MNKLMQEHFRVKVQRLDNVFHRMLVSLERLEVYTETVRLGGKNNESLLTTAIGTDRDMHDDNANPPTRDSFYGEVQMQLSALFFQTHIDDKELFDDAVKYFLGDLLEWYGGRNDNVPYNGVDAFVLPIIVSLSQQVKSVTEVMEVVEKYVASIPRIYSLPDDEKAEAIAQSMEKLIKVMEENHASSHNEDATEEFKLTIHKRGEKVEGYKRLINAMLSMYDEAIPALLVYKTVKNFLPEVTEKVPSITETSINEFLLWKEGKAKKYDTPVVPFPKTEEPEKESGKETIPEKESEKETEPEKESENKKEPADEPLKHESNPEDVEDERKSKEDKPSNKDEEDSNESDFFDKLKKIFK